MSRITKEQSEQIAKKQLAPKFKAIEDRVNDLRDKAIKIRMDKLPEDLRAIYIKYKDSERIFNESSTYLKNESGYSNFLGGYCIGISNVINNKLFEEFKDIESDGKKLKELSDTLAHAIYNLRTHKKIAEHFPELSQFLPKEEGKNELVNFNQLRDLIK